MVAAQRPALEEEVAFEKKFLTRPIPQVRDLRLHLPFGGLCPNLQRSLAVFFVFGVFLGLGCNAPRADGNRDDSRLFFFVYMHP